jgi:hypothetical protein
MKAIRPYVLGFSAVGLLACVGWQVASLLGITALNVLAVPLIVGLFAAHTFNVIQLLPFRTVVRQAPWAGWRLALEGAPKWAGLLVPITSFYFIVVFVLTRPHSDAGKVTDSRWVGLLMSAGFATFYAAAFAYVWAANSRDDGGDLWVCANGHRLDEPVLRCPRCEAEVHALLARPGA